MSRRADSGPRIVIRKILRTVETSPVKSPRESTERSRDRREAKPIDSLDSLSRLRFEKRITC